MDITAEAIVFLVLSVLTLGSALLVVTTRNLFHAALYLMLALFGVAGLFVLLAAPFLAGFQVVVYIGAIAVLIILAVMLTPSVAHLPRIYNAQWAVNVALAVVFFLLLFSVLTPVVDDLGISNTWGANFTQDSPADVPASSISDLGEALVDPQQYMLPFELASVLLMGALIGAALLVSPNVEADEDVPPKSEQGA